MKKVYAIMAALMMLFSINMAVCAAPSPSGTPITEEATDKSPKTGDMNILFVEVAGAALAVTAVVAAKKAKAEA